MDQESESAPEAATPEQIESSTPEAKAPKTFDEKYVRELRSESAKWRIEAQQAREKAEEYENAQKSELEKAQAKVSKIEQAKAEAEGKLLRYEVGQEKEVPAKLLPLLTGSTREELESQATLILENVKASEPEPDFDGGARQPAPDPKTPEEAHNEQVMNLLGLSSNT